MKTPDAAAYQQELTTRGQQLLTYRAQTASCLWDAHALLGTGAAPETVDEHIHRCLPGGMGPFGTLGAMMLVSRWGDDLSASAMALLKEVLTVHDHHRGNTENHWLNHYATTLVATERWPDVEVWWNGLPREAVHAEATRWLLGTIDRTARVGHYEYDSPQYHECHVLNMVLLADHAQDDHLRDLARQMATLYIADMALEYFHGAWAGGHSREGYRQNTWTLSGMAAALGFYYFGDVDYDPEAHGTEMASSAVTAGFQPSPLLAAMARDRGQARVIKKTKAPRAIYRHASREAAPVRKYTYLSPSFALGSTQVGLAGPMAGPIDLVSWDLTWDGPKHRAKIVCNHPYLSPGRFSAFLSETPQAIGRLVGESAKPYLQNPDRLFGASPFEQMAQHESAILVAYRIPADDRAPYVHLYLPREMVWVEQDGWLLGDGGGFYVGIRPFTPYHWMEIVEESLVDGWLLRMEGTDLGLALEAEEAAAAGSFDSFCAQMAGEPRLDLSRWQEAGEVAFTTRRGPRLELTYDGAHRVDRQEIDYDAWPLYEAPGVEGAVGTGRVVFRRDGDELALDFGVDPDKPLLPMRVIG